MNICLVHEEYPVETNFGGIATYQKISAEEYVKQGHNVIVICRGLTKDYEYTENGVKVYRLFTKECESKLEAYTKYRDKVADLLFNLQAENKIDIIEVPDWGAETVLFEKHRKVPLVVRLHTPLKVWLKYNKSDFGDVTDKMLQWENEMLLKADFVTCCSQALKDIICRDFDISDDKIIVTPNPANIVNFTHDSTVIKDDTVVFAGSMEERKGVLVLAKATNLILEKYPHYKIQFIGKDTTRNNKNISTVEYVKEIVKEEFLGNLEFKGQLENSQLNYYFNKAKVGVFPSIFDNFPYTVLESMTTGLHIVGSENSGMREMLNDSESLYDAGDYEDLANKIIAKIEIANSHPVNYSNIETVRTQYHSYGICHKMLKFYDETIKKYKLTKVLQTVFPDETISDFKREIKGVANEVYKVNTESGKRYIVKKYTRNVNFYLSSKLYELYENNDISVIKPININPINLNDVYYNVFPYMESVEKTEVDKEFLLKLLLCDRSVGMKENLTTKCDFYFNSLCRASSLEGITDYEVLTVLDIYGKIRDSKIFKESFLNHGDISFGNILNVDGKAYLIDFDETLVSSRLYDFAVILIKLYSNDWKEFTVAFKCYKDEIQKHYFYSDEDFKVAIKFYLCKILLEKFYLHSTGEIDLFSLRQQTDNYEKYCKLLIKFSGEENYV